MRPIALHPPLFRSLICLLACMVVLPAVELAAQREYEIVGSVTIPQIFFVGDAVEMRLQLDYDGAERLRVPSGRLATTNGLEIDEIRLTETEDYYSLRIFFRPYHPGTQSLPVIDLGAIELTGLGVYVTSIVDADAHELALPRRQALLPATSLSISAIIAGLIALPLLAIVCVRRARGWVDRTVQHYRRTHPYRNMQKTFAYLARSAAQIDARTFYIRLLDDFRTYLSQRTAIDWLAATTSELAAYLSRVDSNRERVRGITNLFRRGDLVKFARHNIPPAVRARHLEQLRRFVASMETEIDLRG